MATESADGLELSLRIPEPLVEWLDERAESEGTNREELLVQLLSAYRTTAESDESPVVVDDIAEAELHDRFEKLEDRLLQLRDAVDEHGHEEIDSLAATLEENVEEVRARVLQLRDAVEGHDHEEFDELSERVTSLAEDLEHVDDIANGVADRNEAITDELELLSSKLDRLARAVVALQRSADDRENRRSLDRLKRTAAVENVATANCSSCGKSVRISLLTEPRCPHCETVVSDVEPAASFFGKPTLRAEPPALEGATHE